MPIKGNSFLNKLILLFVFDKMEVPLSSATIEEMCCQSNDWLNYMDCNPTLSQLKENDFIYEIPMQGGPTLYSITPNGRVCLADFFFNIPSSLRENISKFVKQNRNQFRKKQDYTADYFMNKDGTYTVCLKITDLVGPQFELKFTVPSRQMAKNIYKKWTDKAEHVYATIYESLVD